MSPQTLRVIIALALILHGIGHAMGVLAAFDLADIGNWSSRSWVLDDLLGKTLSHIICVVGFAVLTIGFLVTGLALLDWVVPHDWWRTLAVGLAIGSLVMLTLYWNAFIYLFPHKIGSNAMNIAVIIGLLIADWPTESDIGF